MIGYLQFHPSVRSLIFHVLWSKEELLCHFLGMIDFWKIEEKLFKYSIKIMSDIKRDTSNSSWPFLICSNQAKVLFSFQTKL